MEQSNIKGKKLKLTLNKQIIENNSYHIQSIKKHYNKIFEYYGLSVN